MKRSNFITNQQGFTVTELILVLGLLVVVLATTYNFFYFAEQTSNQALAEGRVAQEAQTTLMQMDREVRQARKATSDNDAVFIFDPEESTTVEINGEDCSVDKGYLLGIYSYPQGQNKPELIIYRLQDSSLQRGTVARVTKHPDVYPWEFNSGTAPDFSKVSNWQIVIRDVENTDSSTEIFEVIKLQPNSDNFRRRQLNVHLKIDDPESPLKKPLEIETVLVSRSRGLAE